MSESKQKTVTAHGEIEYETVECSSCGNDVMKEKAKGFIVYDQDKVKRTHDRLGHYEWEIYDGGYITGWACPYCAEEPLSFPEKKLRDVLENGGAKMTFVFFMIFLFLGLILGMMI